eukprot:11182307-Lingulodinium_polyedra.AAC.1
MQQPWATVAIAPEPTRPKVSPKGRPGPSPVLGPAIAAGVRSGAGPFLVWHRARVRTGGAAQCGDLHARGLAR